MLKIVFVALVSLVMIGCAEMSQSFSRWNSPSSDPAMAAKLREIEKEKMLKSIVYTPLIASRTPTDPLKMEIILRAPTTPFKELGFISMYREDPNQSGATMLPIMKERAAKEGADAILLLAIGEVPTGTKSSASAIPVGDITVANSRTTVTTEGTIRGIAIVYGK